jgi:hypothetical protein
MVGRSIMDVIGFLTEIFRLFNDLNEKIELARVDREELTLVKLKVQSLEVITMATAAQATELKNRIDSIEAALTAEIEEIKAIIAAGDIAESLNRLQAVQTSLVGISDAITGPTAPGPDAEVPSTPGTPTASNVTSTSALLSFDKSTDNVGVKTYEVWANGAKHQEFAETTLPGQFAAAVSGLTPATNYVFTVRAVDAKANVSLHSGEVVVDTLA